MAIRQYWNVKHIRNNKVIWEENYKHNSLANEGALAILNTFYQGTTSAPTQFYVRLCYYSPLVTDTLLSVAPYEPTAYFYGAQPIKNGSYPTGFVTVDTAPDGNPRLTSTIVTFTASGGNIGPVTTAYLATTGGTTNPITGVFTPDNTGILVGFLPLSMQRTILDGDSMTYQFFVEEGNA